MTEYEADIICDELKANGYFYPYMKHCVEEQEEKARMDSLYKHTVKTVED